MNDAKQSDRLSRGQPDAPPNFIALGPLLTPADDAKKLAPLIAIAPVELGGWIDRLHRAGIVVDRHNSPDLLGQLTQGLRRPVDTVLCGVLDVDPHACLNIALAARYPLELAAGVIIVGQLTHARRAAIVTDARMPSSWFNGLRKACVDTGIRIEPVINDYPQADPTLMLYAMLGRRLRPGRLPTDLGVVLFDAAAAIAIGRYALLGEPMLCAPMAVRDHVLDRSFFLTVPIELTIGQVFQKLELPIEGRSLRVGDLLRDVRAHVEMVIGGGELIVHSTLPEPPINPTACIRCGWCVDACPTRVQPASVLEAAQRNDADLAEQAGIEACIQCGVCSYVCPSHLPLLGAIRSIKRDGATM
jgi:electron transport complex protein RnfC